jgi:hypothetical protein
VIVGGTGTGSGNHEAPQRDTLWRFDYSVGMADMHLPKRDAAQEVTPLSGQRTERNAHGQLVHALRDVITDHAIQPHRGDDERQDTKASCGTNCSTLDDLTTCPRNQGKSNPAYHGCPTNIAVITSPITSACSIERDSSMHQSAGASC